MRKLYLLLLLLPLATMMSSGRAHAADPDKALYDAAIAAFPSGGYYITTVIDGVKYYVTASGSLEERTDDVATEDGLFTINQVSGGALYDIGWHIEGANGHFSNTTLTDSKADLNPGTGVFRLDTGNNRNDWESQVFYLDEETGKFAIRSCNTAFGESSWADAGRAFWTYEVDEAGEVVWADYGPMPAYSYEPAYIWTLEQPSGYALIKLVIDNICNDYVDYMFAEPDGSDAETVLGRAFGTEFGQLAGIDTWTEFWNLLQDVDVLWEKWGAYDPAHPDESEYNPADDPDALTLEQAEALRDRLAALYQAILDSEVPYSVPDGYYRIVAHTQYKTSEGELVNKAIAASFAAEHAGKAVYGTLAEDRANYLWKITQHGDSTFIQNAGMGTYVSFSSPGQGRVIMTEDEADASHVVFDYAGMDYTELNGVGEERDIFCIRLASQARHDTYFHQNGHSSKEDSQSPWGHYGTDSGTENEISFWRSTYNYEEAVDTWTSEWFLEPVSDEDAEAIIAAFDAVINHDKLVQQTNELRDQVAETLALAKDVIKTPMITSVNQLDNRFGDSSEGQNIGNLLDNDPSTFWHTTWHGYADGVEPMYYYGEGYEEGRECHFLQISGMDNFVGDCELYLRERDGADNDRVKTLVLMGTDNLKNEDEDWEEMIRITLPHTGKGEENTVQFTIEEAFPYVRVLVIETDYSSYAFRSFWHAAELQLYTVKENPNSQFNQLGEVAEALEAAYNANMQIPDDELTLQDYETLKAAYDAFMKAGIVDPAEMRAALVKYAKATEAVTEGSGPGYWSDKSIADAYDALYAEIDAYDKAGKYNAAQIHKYAVMLKAMQKSVMEQANGVETDKWYRIMYPTEEMFDAYEWSKEGGDKTGLRQEDQGTIFGTYVTAAKEESEEETDVNEDGEEVTTTTTWLEAIGGEDLRESNRLFFMNDEQIVDKDASMFRFVELESDVADYTPLLADVKENMLMALDMSTTYTQGEPLITSAAQFSSNASYPGNDGQKLESGCLIDNNFATYWHSDYGRTFCCVPYLQVALNEPVSGLIQVYVGRRNTSNGHVVRMYVQGSNDAETWTNIGYIETPFIDAATPVTSQPLDLGGTFSHLRFSMTQRSGSDGGSNIEFDPFAEGITADDYNVKYTYFHCSEFQIYPVTADTELSASAQAVQAAYTVANKVVLKDATAEDVAAAAQAYKTFQTEFNGKEGKTVLPNGLDKAPATYALQNKATGLFVMVNGTGNQNNIYLKTIPTLVGYKALGYQRSLLPATTVNGVSCNNLHAGESNGRFCTWGTTDPTTNSGLVIVEADEAYAAPAEFTYFKDVKPGRIIDWCNSVSITSAETLEEASAYTPLGQYTVGEDEDAEIYLALKAIETIPAGEPALYIFGDTTTYDAEDDYVEPVKFKIAGDEKPVLEGKTVNGLIGTLVTMSLNKYLIYFNANYAAVTAEGQSLAVTPCSAVLDLEACPEIDPNDDFDFSICLGQAATDVIDGVKDIPSAIEKISQRGDVYSMDGKLLMSGANLNSLKTLGRGMYILNGVKVLVK